MGNWLMMHCVTDVSLRLLCIGLVQHGAISIAYGVYTLLQLTRALCAVCRVAVWSNVQVSISTDPYAVFQDAEWALMIGAKPRGPGQERADLLDQNGRIFVEQVGRWEGGGG